MIENLSRDLHYSARMLRKSPVFTAVAILSLALGIGANTAVFSLVDTLLLRPLPVPRSDRLVSFFVQHKDEPQFDLTYALFEQIAKQKQIFAGAFTWAEQEFQMRSGPDMVHLDGALASGEYFSTLGVPAQAGRTLTPGDDQQGGGKYGPVAVISDAFWSRHFQRNPSAIGSSLTLDRVRFTIVGVMPSGFFGAEMGTKPDIWVPLRMATRLEDSRIGVSRCINSTHCAWFVTIARLRPGLSEKQAQAALNVAAPRIMRAAVPELPQLKLFLRPAANGWTFLRARFSNPLMILMILVAIVLLIVCANMANLLLARASGRHREIAVRLAIGASRSRVISQLLTESLVLSLLGATAGLFFARWITRLLVASLSIKATVPGFDRNAAFDLHSDWRIVVFTILVAVASGLLFGLMPALRVTRVGIGHSLKARVHNFRGGERKIGIGHWLLSLQTALSVVLVAGAGLFAGSLFHLLMLNPGFDSKNVTLVGIDTDKQPEESAKLIRLYNRLLERVSLLPAVRAASLLWFVPLSDLSWEWAIEVPGRTDLSPQQRLTDINLVGSHFFETMGIPLIAGRDFRDHDNGASEKVTIINQRLAQRFFPNSNPIGKHLMIYDAKARIIGIVGNAKYANLREPDPLTLYVPFTQLTDGRLPSLTFVIKAKNSTPIYPAVRAALHEIAPDVPIGLVKTMRQQIDDSLGSERLMASLSVFFGVLALLLTSIGLYGILGYTVARRTGEIGVRMALGAHRHQVVWLILRETIVHIAIGSIVGVVAVLALSKLVASRLYGIQPNDPGNLVLAVIVLIAIAMLASYLPAYRASRLDPILALREE